MGNKSLLHPNLHCFLLGIFCRRSRRSRRSRSVWYGAANLSALLHRHELSSPSHVPSPQPCRRLVRGSEHVSVAGLELLLHGRRRRRREDSADAGAAVRTSPVLEREVVKGLLGPAPALPPPRC
eukprot:755212-Hanusia_phi.AAC.3